MSWLQLPKDRNTREQEKFVLKDGEVAVRTDTTLSGTIEATPGGLSTGFLITTMDIGNTATPIPATPLALRNSLSISNLSETETLYIGPDTAVTADAVNGTTSGWEVPPLGTLNLDAKYTIIIYGITATTLKVKVLEIA